MCSIEERIGAGRQDARILQAICWWHTDRYAKQNMCGEYSWDSQPVSLLRYVHHWEWKQWLLPFLGTQFFNRSSRLETKVYVKPTNTGLLLHYKSHANARYKRALPKTILDRAFRLSSNWSYFSEECDRLKLPFFRLKYSDKLIHSTISRFICHKIFWSTCFITCGCFWFIRGCSCYFTIFKDQSSADIVRRQLQDLSHKIYTTVSPVFVSQKIERDLNMPEAKPPLVNQQYLVYKFECDLCDAGYVGTQKRKFIHRPALSC